MAASRPARGELRPFRLLRLPRITGRQSRAPWLRARPRCPARPPATAAVASASASPASRVMVTPAATVIPRTRLIRRIHRIRRTQPTRRHPSTPEANRASPPPFAPEQNESLQLSEERGPIAGYVWTNLRADSLLPPAQALSTCEHERRRRQLDHGTDVVLKPLTRICLARANPYDKVQERRLIGSGLGGSTPPRLPCTSTTTSSTWSGKPAP
jgi:hypothetical protein